MSLPAYSRRNHKYSVPTFRWLEREVLFENNDLSKHQQFMNWNVLVWEIQILKSLIIIWNYRENFKSFFSPWKLLMISLLTKYKNLQISSSLSLVIMKMAVFWVYSMPWEPQILLVIMFPNPSVEITLFIMQYVFKVSFWIMPISINRPKTT